MSYAPTHMHTDRAGLRNRLNALLSRIGHGLVTYMDRQSRREQIRALQSKSDMELRALGITRDHIVAYVFRDRMA